MSKKGFTLIELLAVIVILGILSTTAVISVTSYLNKSKEHAFKELKSTFYQATQNYIMENVINIEKTDTISITSTELKDLGYIDDFSDPNNDNKSCTGTIQITNNSATGSSDVLIYKINLACSKYKTNGYETYSE